jgi:hypothetical protein
MRASTSPPLKTWPSSVRARSSSRRSFGFRFDALDQRLARLRLGLGAGVGHRRVALLRGLASSRAVPPGDSACCSVWAGRRPRPRRALRAGGFELHPRCSDSCADRPPAPERRHGGPARCAARHPDGRARRTGRAPVSACARASAAASRFARLVFESLELGGQRFLGRFASGLSPWRGPATAASRLAVASRARRINSPWASLLLSAVPRSATAGLARIAASARSVSTRGGRFTRHRLACTRAWLLPSRCAAVSCSGRELDSRPPRGGFGLRAGVGDAASRAAASRSSVRARASTIRGRRLRPARASATAASRLASPSASRRASSAANDSRVACPSARASATAVSAGRRRRIRPAAVHGERFAGPASGPRARARPFGVAPARLPHALGRDCRRLFPSDWPPLPGWWRSATHRFARRLLLAGAADGRSRPLRSPPAPVEIRGALRFRLRARFLGGRLTSRFRRPRGRLRRAPFRSFLCRAPRWGAPPLGGGPATALGGLARLGP